jgi:hypothetical protein
MPVMQLQDTALLPAGVPATTDWCAIDTRDSTASGASPDRQQLCSITAMQALALGLHGSKGTSWTHSSKFA